MKKHLLAKIALATFCIIASPDTTIRAADTPITPIPPQAALRVATVQVRVAPDHRDWTYEPGDKVRFRIAVTADGHAIDDAHISYTVGPEGMPAEMKTAALPQPSPENPDGDIVIEGGVFKSPGFMRCNVTTQIAGRAYRASATAACAPEKIRPTQTEPADFDAFWKSGKDALAAVPMDARVTLLPDACTETVNVYHVSFRVPGESWQGKARIYGILCEPKAPGKYPAILRMPGAGVRPYFGDKDLASRGAITLEIGVHGIPVNQPKEIYDQLLSGPLNGYWLFNLDDRETYYYRRVILGALRANDFLTTRPMWNGKDLLAAGASQGGMLSIAAAALDPRVTALAATHPALCDLTGDLHNRAGGWPRPFQKTENTTNAKLAVSGYYDTVNFARRVRAPGFYIWGYNDDVCPPTSIYAAYNVITAPKTLALTLEMAHTYSTEQYDAITAWIVKTLGL